MLLNQLQAFDNLSSLADIEEKHALEKRFWKEGYMSQIGGDLWVIGQV